MGGCGAKPAKEPEQPQPQQQQSNAQPVLEIQQQEQAPLPPQFPENTDIYKRLLFLVNENITQYLAGKHPGNENIFESYEQKMNIQKSEISIYIGLLQKQFTFEDHFFDHVKDLHQKISNLLKNEVEKIQSYEAIWTNDDFILLKTTIMYLIEVKHVVVTIQQKKPQWWDAKYFQRYFQYLNLHQEKHESFWHDDLKDVLLIERQLKFRLDKRIKEIEDAIKKEEEEFLKKQKMQLMGIHDEVIKRAHEENEDVVNHVKEMNYKYATPKIMES